MPSSTTVLITGCSLGGIGDHLARQFAKKGCTVFATARSLSKIEHLRELGCHIVQLDVTDEESLKACVGEVRRITTGGDTGEEGVIDILVNNAGLACAMPLLDVSITDARRCFDANYFGVLATIQTFSPLLIAAAKGRIINISSVAQFSPVPFLGVYNSSKAALSLLSSTLRIELSPFGIAVINVITGGVSTNIFDNQIIERLPERSVYDVGNSKSEIENVMAGSVARRFQSPVEDVARKVVREALSRWPRSNLCVGSQSSVMWAASTFLWVGFLDLPFSFLYGLWGVKKNLRLKEQEKRAGSGK